MPEADDITSEILAFDRNLHRVADNLALCETDTEKAELLTCSLRVYVSVSCLTKSSLHSVELSADVMPQWDTM